MNFSSLLSSLGTGLLAGGPIGGAIGVAGAFSADAASAASEAAYQSNQTELIAANTNLNTMAVKSAETTNTQEFHVAVEEAHNHVVRSYIEAVKQTQ
jgi:hypothetical protein